MDTAMPLSWGALLKRWWPYFSLVAGAASVLSGFSLVLFSAHTETTAPSHGVVVCEAPVPSQIAIDVAGGVLHPGVYWLPVDSLTGDAIEAAGGLSDQADTIAVAHTLNLAAVLSSNTKVYVPIEGESATNSQKDVLDSPQPRGVSINTATEQQLQALTGIGEKRAADIVSGRPYTRIEELVERGILSESLLSELGNQLTT